MDRNGKELSEMTLDDLCHLFPVFLVAHNEQWKKLLKYWSKTDLLECLLTWKKPTLFGSGHRKPIECMATDTDKKYKKPVKTI